MSVLLEIGILVVGFIAGFAAARYIKPQESATPAPISNELEAYKQAAASYQAGVEDYLNQTSEQLKSLGDQYEQLRLQLENRYHLLPNSPDLEVAPAPFFGQDAFKHIQSATKSKAAKEPKAAIESQPLDYSGSASGLFSDEKQEKKAASES